MKLPKISEYPKQVHLGNYTYQVKFVKSLSEDTVGLCDPERETIFILKGIGPVATLRTFIHECLHALEFVYDIQIKHKSVHQLDEAIADFLIQNF